MKRVPRLFRKTRGVSYEEIISFLDSQKISYEMRTFPTENPFSRSAAIELKEEDATRLLEEYRDKRYLFRDRGVDKYASYYKLSKGFNLKMLSGNYNFENGLLEGIVEVHFENELLEDTAEVWFA